MKKICCVIFAVAMVFAAGCGQLESEGTEKTTTSPATTARGIETLEEAMQWYMTEQYAHMYLEGDYFAFTYRILETQDLPGIITIYAHTLCSWVNPDGEEISGGAGLAGVTFYKDNGFYEYDSATLYDIPEGPDIPQTVKDAVAEAAYFPEMQAELDVNIQRYLHSN